MGAGIKATNDSDPTTIQPACRRSQHGLDKYQWQMRAIFSLRRPTPIRAPDLNNGRPPLRLPDGPVRQSIDRLRQRCASLAIASIVGACVPTSHFAREQAPTPAFDPPSPSSQVIVRVKAA